MALLPCPEDTMVGCSALAFLNASQATVMMCVMSSWGSAALEDASLQMVQISVEDTLHFIRWCCESGHAGSAH